MARKKKEEKVKKDMVEVNLKHRITINSKLYHGKVIVSKKLAGNLRMLDSGADRQNRSL